MVGRVDDELTLVVVDNHGEDQVDGEDEQLSTSHTLPEIPRTLHFSHEFDKDESTTVRVDDVHTSVKLTLELVASTADDDMCYNRAFDNMASTCCGNVVWKGDRDASHRGDDDKDVHPDGGISQETKLGQTSDLTNNGTCDGPDENEYSVATFTLCNLRKTLTVTQDDDGNVTELLDRLEEINEITGVLTVDTADNVTVVSQRIFDGVQV